MWPFNNKLEGNPFGGLRDREGVLGCMLGKPFDTVSVIKGLTTETAMTIHRGGVTLINL
jgi:hypothetical protein